MDEATQAALENALEIALEAIYTNSASTPTTPAEPIRALAHQLLGIADGKTGSNEDAVPANSVDPDDTDTWTVANVVESLALEHHIASAIGVPADADQFEFCKTLTKPELLERLREARLEGLVEPLWRGVEGLSLQAAATGSELSQKFAMEGITMALGGLSAFTNGLEAIIGPALLATGEDGKKTLMNQV